MHVDLGVGIERAERLVHQQYLRLHHQRSHQRRALAHAARQRRWIGMFETLQACLRHAGRDALLALPPPERPPASGRSRYCRPTVRQGNSVSRWKM
jgi:hypothetical protein